MAGDLEREGGNARQRKTRDRAHADVSKSFSLRLILHILIIAVISCADISINHNRLATSQELISVESRSEHSRPRGCHS